MVTNRASGSPDQADGTTQKKTRINRERSRLIWTETCTPVPEVDGVVRHSGRSEVNKNLGEKRVAVNGPYVSGFFDHDAVVSGPEPILQECPNVGKTVTKSRTRLTFLANCIGGSSLLATVLGSTTLNPRIVGRQK